MATLTVPALSEEALLEGSVSRIVLECFGESWEERDRFFDAICRQYPDLQMEQMSTGEVVLMAPEGNESSYRNVKISVHLDRWSEVDGRGVSFGANTVFKLPDGSKRGPDAAWVSLARLETTSRKDRRGFLRLAPEFVIELKSPTDSWPRLQRKMEVWRQNGVELGWLIDADKRLVLVYSTEAEEPTELRDPKYVEGSGPVKGFRLEMKDIWRGLDL